MITSQTPGSLKKTEMFVNSLLQILSQLSYSWRLKAVREVCKRHHHSYLRNIFEYPNSRRQIYIIWCRHPEIRIWDSGSNSKLRQEIRLLQKPKPEREEIELWISWSLWPTLHWQLLTISWHVGGFLLINTNIYFLTNFHYW